MHQTQEASMTEKKQPLDMTTEEAIRKLFPAKVVREARRQVVPDPLDREEAQVERPLDVIEDDSSD